MVPIAAALGDRIELSEPAVFGGIIHRRQLQLLDRLHVDGLGVQRLLVDAVGAHGHLVPCMAGEPGTALGAGDCLHSRENGQDGGCGAVGIAGNRNVLVTLALELGRDLTLLGFDHRCRRGYGDFRLGGADFEADVDATDLIAGEDNFIGGETFESRRDRREPVGPLLQAGDFIVALLVGGDFAGHDVGGDFPHGHGHAGHHGPRWIGGGPAKRRQRFLAKRRKRKQQRTQQCEKSRVSKPHTAPF